MQTKQTAAHTHARARPSATGSHAEKRIENTKRRSIHVRSHALIHSHVIVIIYLSHLNIFFLTPINRASCIKLYVRVIFYINVFVYVTKFYDVIVLQRQIRLCFTRCTLHVCRTTLYDCK